MKQDEIREIDVSGEPAHQWEGFLCYATDRLKTPVTSLGLALQCIEDVQSEEERRIFFKMAKRGQRELSEAVEEVLETARKEQRRI